MVGDQASDQQAAEAAGVNILQEALTRAGSAQSHAEGVNVSPIFGWAVHAELGSHPLKRVALHMADDSSPEQEMEFVGWTTRYLIVKHPPSSPNAGEDWRMGRNLVNHYLAQGRLRIEGEIPELALIE